MLEELVAATGDEEHADHYGTGDAIQAFESEVAELFGKERGLFFPTGIMTQQIALRVWCDRRGSRTIAMHPTAHLEWAEHLGHAFLHGLTRLQFAAPELLRNRLINAADLAGMGVEPGVALLELPHRPLGGQLPEWSELGKIRSWADERGVPLHLDGARVWSCRPFYGRSLAQIGALFDSIYVSFYKDLGGLAGSMLVGSDDFVEEAAVWRVRHGGRLATFAPYIVSARQGLRERLPLIDGWVARAREIAGILASQERVTVDPDPPHTNIFRVFVAGDAEELDRRHLALAEETGTFVFSGFGRSDVPGVATTEVHCWEKAAAFPLDELEPFLTRLLG
jgi:threonine aldolase